MTYERHGGRAACDAPPRLMHSDAGPTRRYMQDMGAAGERRCYKDVSAIYMPLEAFADDAMVPRLYRHNHNSPRRRYGHAALRYFRLYADGRCH